MPSLPMPRPYTHPKTGVYWLRLRVPRDLRHAVGKGEIKRSLRTKDPAEAKRLFPAALQAAQREFDRLRRAPEPLDRRQVVALAGEAYREFISLGGRVPEGDADVWRTIGALYEHLSLAPPDAREAFLGRTVDRRLAAAGLNADVNSRAAIMAEVIRASREAAAANIRIAEGDFTLDPVANRFPSLAPPAAPKVTLSGLLSSWERDHAAAGGAPSTRAAWRRMVRDFIKHVGHDDAKAVTPRDVTAYADHLRHDRGFTAKTISDSYLAALKGVYRHGISKNLLSDNPTQHVKVRADRPRKVRSKGFTEGEAKAILSAALEAPDDAHRRKDARALTGAARWLPWLAAYTGARIGELVQLSREDFREEGGVAFVHITPEAGTVKAGEFRDVPLHPHLLELGILAFVEGSKGRRLFPSNGAQRVARFVRAVLDLPPGRGVSPNHAWRHRFKTLAREAGLDLRAAAAIQRHADGSASGGYGEWSLKALHREIVKLPRVELVRSPKDAPPVETEGAR